MPIFHSAAEVLRGSSVHDLKYLPTHTEPGMMKMLIEYPLNDEGMNLIFRLPTHEEKYTGMQSDKFYGWYPLLDNTRFSRKFIINMQEKEISKFRVGIFNHRIITTDCHDFFFRILYCLSRNLD